MSGELLAAAIEVHRMLKAVEALAPIHWVQVRSDWRPGVLALD
jgi:hypothetical protein